MMMDLSCFEDYPRHDIFVFVIDVYGVVSDAVGLAIAGTIEAMTISSCDVDGIGKSIFAQGVSKAPKGLRVARFDIIKSVISHSG